MGYCCTNDRIKKQSSMLFKLNAKNDTDELEIISFTIRQKNFSKRRFEFLDILNQVRFDIVIVNYINKESEDTLIYLIVNIGDNYFFSLNYNDGIITEINISSQVGFYPSLQKLNDSYLIAIGGKDDRGSNVNLYDLYNQKWYFVGNLSTPRNGAYAILHNEENIFYICGGSSIDGDNTLEIEYFNLVYPINKNTNDCKSANMLTDDYYPVAIKIKKINNEFLLREVSLIVLLWIEDNAFLICRGSSIFQETTTCVAYYTERDIIHLSKLQLPKQISFPNQNYLTHKNLINFFISNNEVISYCAI